MRWHLWFDVFVPVMLAVSTVFSVIYENWGSAVVIGICFGFCAGMSVTRRLLTER
jgi:putative effector of murein hydrolase LrgA (UPF0299 family)